MAEPKNTPKTAAAPKADPPAETAKGVKLGTVQIEEPVKMRVEHELNRLGRPETAVKLYTDLAALLADGLAKLERPKSLVEQAMIKAGE